MTMRQITPHDATFYYAEGDSTFAHGTFLWFYDGKLPGGGKFGYADLFEHISSRLHVSEILTQKLKPVPMHLDYPYWVTDEDFDLENHLHHIELAEPGDWETLNEQLSRIHSEPLDLSEPLWDMTLVTGLDGIDWLPKGAFALLAKFHHVAIDGATGMSIIGGLHDQTPERAQQCDAVVEDADPPGLGDMLSRAAINGIRKPLDFIRLGAGLVADLPKVLPHFRLSDTADIGKAPATLFNKDVSDTRVFDNQVLRVDDIKALRRGAEDATFNDVVLTIAAGGLRRYLEAHDDLPFESMVAGCPISVRGEDEADTGGNRITAMTTEIHTNVADPIERLKLVTRSTKKAKATVGALGPRRMMEINDSIPALTMFSMNKLMEIAPSGSGDRRFFNCSISNLPGPQVPLYLDGARLLYVSCAMPVMHGYGLFIGALTYDGNMCIALSSSDNILPEPSELGECMVESFEELQAAVEGMS